MVEKAELLGSLLFPGLVNSGNSRTEMTILNRCTCVDSTWWMCANH